MVWGAASGTGQAASKAAATACSTGSSQTLGSSGMSARPCRVCVCVCVCACVCACVCGVCVVCVCMCVKDLHRKFVKGHREKGGGGWEGKQ